MKANEPRAEHIKRLQERYQGADKRKKTVILTEFCLTWNVDRKHAIKLLNGKRGRPAVRPSTTRGSCGTSPCFGTRWSGSIRNG